MKYNTKKKKMVTGIYFSLEEKRKYKLSFKCTMIFDNLNPKLTEYSHVHVWGYMFNIQRRKNNYLYFC